MSEPRSWQVLRDMEKKHKDGTLMERSINLKRDGDQVVAVYDGFQDLQNSPAGFGDTVETAVLALFQDDPEEAKGDLR